MSGERVPAMARCFRAVVSRVTAFKDGLRGVFAKGFSRVCRVGDAVRVPRSGPRARSGV